MKIAEDNRNTTEWAIALLGGVSGVVSGQAFKLANRVTGRAHDLYFVGGGLTVGIDFDVSKSLEYTSVRTKRPANFNDLDGKAARLTAIRATVGLGYAKNVLTMWEGPPYFSHVLAKVMWGGLEFGKLGLKGQCAVHGVVAVKYGNGDPRGLIVREIDPALSHDPVSLTPAIPYIRYAPSERPLIAFPEDVLFAFDSATIKPSAVPLLERASDVISSRDRGRVLIEGHTDSVGSDRYNGLLSIRRATAVKNWLVQRGLYGAHNFIVRGMGESRPIAPNRVPSGADDPAARAKNRRVEIHFEG